MAKLMVVDFDYFFPNPTMMDPGLLPGDVKLGLYDWGHHESQLMASSMLWGIRAAGFDRWGEKRPGVEGADAQWWSRFRRKNTPLLAADSNLYAAFMEPGNYGIDGDGWEEVWLFDAHHDSGYRPGAEAEYRETGIVTCENWMILPHVDLGSELHVRYPPWRRKHDTIDGFYECETAPEIPVDRRLFDPDEEFPEFDAVFACRSGAWVPAWCDSDFEAFLTAAHRGDAIWVDEKLPRDRDWNEEEIRQQIAATFLLEELMNRQDPPKEA